MSHSPYYHEYWQRDRHHRLNHQRNQRNHQLNQQQHHHHPRHPQYPSQHSVQYMNRPTEDPVYYDKMFQQQTREEKNSQHKNRQMNEYHLFAPKYHNNNAPTLGNNQRISRDLAQTKRGQQQPFPDKTAPFIPTGQRPQIPSQITHPLDERRIDMYQSIYRTDSERVSDFNRTIDSMHLPDDMQRPIATRELIKSSLDENSISHASPTADVLSNRQFDLEQPSLFKTAGTYEDMFYT